MPSGDRSDESVFRAGARAWLASNVGPYRVDADPGSPSVVFPDVDDTASLERGVAWQRALHGAGWAGLGWPIEHGGRGLPPGHQAVWAEELSAAGAPTPVNLLGEVVVGPALMAHGTAAQQARFLPPILSAGELWCQLFSEPEAGSDLAGVTTAASREGDGWRVSGHKTWSSGAHYADLGLLLARTDPVAPKHRGLTCFVVDMRQPGVTVRPVRQMTGGRAFDDVILDAASAPDEHRLGDEGDGWAVARTCLTAERLSLGLGLARSGASVDRILAELRPRGVADDPEVRQLAARLVVDARSAQYLGRRLLAGDPPGAEVALAKLASARVSRRYDELAAAMRGAGAMVHDEHTLRELWAPATRIAGGTDEILRDVIAERLLGLPREPRAADVAPGS